MIIWGTKVVQTVTPERSQHVTKTNAVQTFCSDASSCFADTCFMFHQGTYRWCSSRAPWRTPGPTGSGWTPETWGWTWRPGQAWRSWGEACRPWWLCRSPAAPWVPCTPCNTPRCRWRRRQRVGTRCPICPQSEGTTRCLGLGWIWREEKTWMSLSFKIKNEKSVVSVETSDDGDDWRQVVWKIHVNTELLFRTTTAE